MILVNIQKVHQMNPLGLLGVITYMQKKLLSRTIVLTPRDVVDV